MTKHVPFPKSLQQLLQRILEAIDQAGGCMTRAQLATTLHDARPLDIDDTLEELIDRNQVERQGNDPQMLWLVRGTTGTAHAAVPEPEPTSPQQNISRALAVEQRLEAIAQDVLDTALDARAAGLPAPLVRLLMQCDGALAEARNHLTL
ncbi:hypothetical protein [Stenotrophomonas maltophilia]|uniref:hypothetical protein n=1 Tax=Stenotrophomonas maltophilia TaxID=40324 RepID=UPI0018D3634B|nr:hypothetical protein [Stenotrophomonas maltophilia]MBA2128428.1 hypothetical protein [Stenotrophomonas maltophilia]MBH1527549.1 hypothetical protein [Stenotrophomonas maltophilia]